MPTFIPSAWAAILLLFLWLCTRRPPNSPSPELVAGQDDQLTFFERWCERHDPMADIWDGGASGPRYSKTPCGRSIHVRSWSDLH